MLSLVQCKFVEPKEPRWAHGVVVSTPLSMREVLGSIPSVSTLRREPFVPIHEERLGWRRLGSNVASL